MFFFYNKFINSQIFERLLLIEGTMTWPNGDIYIGNWLNDQRSGQGKQFYLIFFI